jgi:hypothetical protein
MNPQANRMGGAPMGQPMVQPRPQGINIEELMKKIDAKIAELEAEEQAEKENANNKLNPLINEAKDLPSKPKDDEERKLPESNVSSFNDLINKNTDTSPMVTNKIDESNIIPKFPSEPIINKPLTGIVDPTKQMTIESMQKVEPITVKPASEPKKEEKKETPKENPYNYVSDDQFFDDFFDEE